MRRYLKGENPDFVAIINNKIYGNPEGNLDSKIKKKRRKNSGSNDSDINIIRIRFNPLSLYNTNNEQEWRIFVNTLDNY